jgi:hypothetical protein
MSNWEDDNVQKKELEVSSDELTIPERVQKEARKWAPVFRVVILLLISLIAILVRVFSVSIL